MARPSKFNAARAGEIAARLKTGCSRKASAESAGVSYDCFLDWLQAGRRAADLDDRTPEQEAFYQFFQAVTRAEAEMEVRNAALISKAAGEHDTHRTVRTVKTVVKPRKLRLSTGGTVTTRHPDGTITRTEYPRGTVLEEPVAFEEVSEQTTEAVESDWHAALELLKRRRPADWGDRKQIDVRTLTDDQLLGLLVDEAADSESDDSGGNAGEAGGGSAAAGPESAGDIL